MTFPDDEQQFRPNHFALVCHRQTKAACKEDLAADKCEDKKFDDELNDADCPEVASDSVLVANADNSDNDGGCSAADSHAGESVSDNVSDSENASSNNPSASYSVVVDNINFSLENEDFNSTVQVLHLLREDSDGLSRIPRGSRKNIEVILYNSATGAAATDMMMTVVCWLG
ncbi:hypothetical protein RRG08_024776 [Elysia crispata]|uniref:Uncharacterized protein n=1 Tax=Elysia crispata TaxID=231223 RepID=A0AAE0Y5P8_9GAST|nr:hypothetical protein RRG08_024776 [Elysia crispata]